MGLAKVVSARTPIDGERCTVIRFPATPMASARECATERTERLYRIGDGLNRLWFALGEPDARGFVAAWLAPKLYPIRGDEVTERELIDAVPTLGRMGLFAVADVAHDGTGKATIRYRPAGCSETRDLVLSGSHRDARDEHHAQVPSRHYVAHRCRRGRRPLCHGKSMTDQQPPNRPENVLQFPVTPTIAARECAADPTSQLLESLFAGYRIAITAYQRAPTSARWCELKRSFACWHTAFLTECRGEAE